MRTNKRVFREGFIDDINRFQPTNLDFNQSARVTCLSLQEILVVYMYTVIAVFFF